MQSFEVQVLERVPQKYDARTMQKMTAEQLAALKPHTFRPRNDLRCMVDGETVHEAKAVAKQVLLPRIAELQPPTRVLSVSVVANPSRVKIIVERVAR